jgi:hypothetical protein
MTDPGFADFAQLIRGAHIPELEPYVDEERLGVELVGKVHGDHAHLWLTIEVQTRDGEPDSRLYDDLVNVSRGMEALTNALRDELQPTSDESALEARRAIKERRVLTEAEVMAELRDLLEMDPRKPPEPKTGYQA